MRGDAVVQLLEMPIRTWRSPEPRRMPALRGVLSHWLAVEGANFYEVAIRHGVQEMGVARALPTRENAEQLATAERSRVTGGLTWVDASMTRLAVQAGRQLPCYDLFPYHLPSPRGFMVFEDPIGLLWSDEGTPVEIVAVSWGPWEGPESWLWPNGGIWMTFYSSHRDARYLRSTKRVVGELGMADVDPLLPYNEAGWPFGELAAIEFPAESTAQWARTVVAAWLLMRQPLHAEIVSGPAMPTSAKKRMRRVGLPTSGVDIVRVRRRASGSHSGSRDGGYTWTRRVTVPPFWRRYHVGPGRSRIEWMWIDEYEAGPPNAPLREVERVRVWNR